MDRRRHAIHAVTTTAALAGLVVGSLIAETASAAPAAHRSAAAVTAPVPYGEVVVSDGAAIRIYAPDADGNVAPVRTITGSNTGLELAMGLGLDAAGDIWVTDYAQGRVSEFAADADGDVAPLRVIEPTSDVSNPEGLALAPAGALVWVGNFNNSSIPAFSTSADGPTAPTRRIAGGSTGLSFVPDITITPDGAYLWAPDVGYDLVKKFSTTGVADQAPLRELQLPAGAHEMRGVAADRFGSVWVSDSDSDTIYLYALSSDTTPVSSLAGPLTGIDDPNFISLDARDHLWAAITGNATDGVDPSVEEFAPGAYGNVTPLRRISGPATQLESPRDVAVFGTAPGAPTALEAVGGKRKIKLSWQAPVNTGGGLLGYIIRRKASKSAPWQNIAAVATLNFTDRHRHPHHRYRYDVIAYNEIGNSPAGNTASAVAHR